MFNMIEHFQVQSKGQPDSSCANARTKPSILRESDAPESLLGGDHQWAIPFVDEGTEEWTERGGDRCL